MVLASSNVNIVMELSQLVVMIIIIVPLISYVNFMVNILTRVVVNYYQ